MVEEREAGCDRQQLGMKISEVGIVEGGNFSTILTLLYMDSCLYVKLLARVRLCWK